ncbi:MULTISPECIES: protease HtpX [Myxococcus]|uniref:Protease HtpX homolog n=1 Tax=Myxococcus xanthus TaxID=34 RepID=A0AAE6KQB7_MYXXA|nr:MULTISPECIES: protease HtpX [Myxococcus]QDE66021.1 zinc metalloprotease HtpX [Myxococcus xanthus]QDE73293.1 zinc metalloprotease HtpX [Myxococcus xanthus]QDE80564.1 zinc metalloprotease HtpX [Myxococcus xanthus]QDE94879.1 zinc metalloprotease HtpX [Myxococcus xanthus]QDF02137.1 zinc metalloprotease HtpX [Myxococcus xanthus]
MKGSFAKRITLFVLTNLAVVAMLAIVGQLIGVENLLARRGVGLNLPGLLIMAAVMGFGGAIFSLLISKPMAKWSTGAKVITSPRSEDERWLLETVHRLARDAGIGMPDVAIYDSPDMNAFATGAKRNSALVAVSTGLLHGMKRDEVEAVLGHEVAHVANGDMVTLTLLQGVLNTFVIFLSRVVGFFVDRFLSRSEDGEESGGSGPAYFITSIVLQIVFGIGASMIVAWYSRRREFRADDGGAQLVDPGAMARALNRLRMQQGEPAMLPSNMQAFGIRGGGMMALFSSHPPLELRIQRLMDGSWKS